MCGLPSHGKKIEIVETIFGGGGEKLCLTV